MFEVGTTYNFETIEHDAENHWSARVIEIDGPLIKVERTDGPVILNTHCSAFKAARPWSAALHARAAEDEAAWAELLPSIKE
jgi:hypothetical protein